MASIRTRHRAVIVGAGVLLTIPVLVLGFPLQSNDAIWHVLWYRHFSDQLWGGELYPRWLMGMNDGLGSPSFFFYGPVAYWLASPLRPLFGGLGADSGWMEIGVAAVAALIASGLLAYQWLVELTGERAALVGALVFVVAPYHLAFDLYSRGGYTEVVSFVWLPLALLATERVARGSMHAVVALAVVVALLVMTHPVTSLTFVAVLAVYAGAVAPRGRRAGAVVRTVAALALGAALSAAYLAPALGDQRNVSFERMRIGWGHYANSFILSKPRIPSVYRNRMLAINALTLSTLLLALCGFVASRRGPERVRRPAAFWAAVAVASTFMMTPVSALVWRFLPLLQSAQFPWRFNTVLAMAAAATVACGATGVSRPLSRVTRVLVGVAVVVLLGWAGYTAATVRLAYPQFKRIEETLQRVDFRRQHDRDPPEYEPRWAPRFAGPAFAAGLAERRDASGRVARVRIVGGDGAVEVRDWRPRQLTVRVDARDGATLDVGQFYYPGWTARVTGSGVPLPVRPSSTLGVVQVDVPSGVHDVEIRLEPGANERWGRVVSAVAAGLLLVLLLWSWRYGNRREALTETPGGRLS